MKENSNREFLIVAVIIFLSRLPFITTGYGSEEDAWGLALTADRIAASGNYEVSRLPGHPFQEIIYALLHNSSFIVWNLLTVIISTAGIYALMRTLCFLKVGSITGIAIAIAFIPVIYINSFCVMDYTWALSGILGSFYFLCRRNYIASGVLLGLAIGCRITAGAMLLPFIIYMFLSEKNIPVRQMFALSASVAVTAALCFLPVYLEYGPGFFMYYEHFPIPAFAKNLYKGTLGVAGTTGLAAICIAWIFSLKNIIRIVADRTHPYHPLIIMSCISIALYVFAFIRLPLKSAFMIPALPFIMIVPATVLSKKSMNVFAVAMIASSFFLGVNLADPNRGSVPSALSFTTNINNQPVSFDFLKGPVIADHEKQKTLIAYSDHVIEEVSKMENPSVVIAGWYLNFIECRKEHSNNSKASYVYYIDADSMNYYLKNRYSLYYLPLQDQFNDVRFKMDVTSLKAKPFPG